MLKYGYSWEQVCVKLQAGAIYFLIGHATLMVNPVVYLAAETLHCMKHRVISTAIKDCLKFDLIYLQQSVKQETKRYMRRRTKRSQIQGNKRNRSIAIWPVTANFNISQLP